MSHALPTSRKGATTLAPRFCFLDRHASVNPSLHRFQRLRQVCAEVFDIFQADVEAHDAMAVVWAVFRGVEVVSDCQTGHARPAISDLEQLEGVHKMQNLLFGKFALEDDRKESSRSGEIALPELMAGARWKRGMQ